MPERAVGIDRSSASSRTALHDDGALVTVRQLELLAGGVGDPVHGLERMRSDGRTRRL